MGRPNQGALVRYRWRSIAFDDKSPSSPVEFVMAWMIEDGRSWNQTSNLKSRLVKGNYGPCTGVLILATIHLKMKNIGKNQLIKFCQEILYSHFTGYLARICERDAWTITRNLPNKDQNIIDIQVFDGPSLGLTKHTYGETQRR